MKIKFVSSNFDKETGISTVTINTKYGHFTGRAKMNAADANHPSEFRGCSYAEVRAHIKALKAKHRNTNTQLYALRNLYKEFESCKEFNGRSREAWHTRRYIKQLENEANNELTSISNAEGYLRQLIEYDNRKDNL